MLLLPHCKTEHTADVVISSESNRPTSCCFVSLYFLTLQRDSFNLLPLWKCHSGNESCAPWAASAPSWCLFFLLLPPSSSLFRLYTSFSKKKNQPSTCCTIFSGWGGWWGGRNDDDWRPHQGLWGEFSASPFFVELTSSKDSRSNVALQVFKCQKFFFNFVIINSIFESIIDSRSPLIKGLNLWPSPTAWQGSSRRPRPRPSNASSPSQ